MLIPKISIIVPIYNASDYLRPCIDSLIHQSLKELEIILVNDCSPDPMDEQICLEYKALDERIVYIRHEQNLGPGGARNTGVRNATAPYLGFIDSDDLVHQDMFQNCLAVMEADHYDVVQCNYAEISLSGITQNKVLPFDQSKALLGLDILKELSGSDSLIFKGIWNKVWKKEIFTQNNLIFPENNCYDDFFMSCVYLIYCQKIMLLPEVYYFYRQRESSITGRIKTKNIRDYTDILKQTREAFLVRAAHLDVLDYINKIHRSGLAYCANMAYGQAEAQQAFVAEMKQNLLLQHLNYFQLRFVLNYLAVPAEKRLWHLWILCNEMLTQLGVKVTTRQALEKGLKKLNALRKL